MKFGNRLLKNRVPEWSDFYVNYRVLKKFLSAFKAYGKIHLQSKVERERVIIENLDVQEQEQLDRYLHLFESLLFSDLKKVFSFYTTKLNDALKKWKKYKLNVLIVKNHTSISRDQKKKNQQMLKESFHVIHKEFKLLDDFLQINLEAFGKILKKAGKYVKPIIPNLDLKKRFDIALANMKAYKAKDRLTNFLDYMQNDYIDTFHKNKKEGVKELKTILKGKLISRSELFIFGLFLGFSMILVLTIIVLSWDGNLDLDNDELFREIFPMFRGLAILICYMFLVSWNVYGWTKFNVNYKLIFKFNHHYSEVSQVLKRAAFFASMFLIFFVWYVLVQEKVGDLADGLGFLPKEVLPFIGWLIFLLYVFFPSGKYLNGEGRVYMLKVIKDSITAPCIGVEFPVIWLTDQLTSFVTPLKDLEYTICYYIAYFFQSDSDIQDCHASDRWSRAIIFALFPLVMRLFHCLRQCYDKGTICCPEFINAGKYFMSIVTSVVSYLNNLADGSLLPAWITCAIISTLYSYSWDLKKDWGFLQKNSKIKLLRNELSYDNPLFYYTAMTLNLMFRCAWVFSISPDIVRTITRPELFSLIIGFLEIFRRSIWNFLRVEKEHIANVGSFKAVKEMNLPYPDVSYDQDINEDDILKQDLKNYLERDPNAHKKTKNNRINPDPAIIHQASQISEIPPPDFANLRRKVSDEQGFRDLRKLATLVAQPISGKEEGIDDLSQFKPDNSLFKKWLKEVSAFKSSLQKKSKKFRIFPEPKADEEESLTSYNDVMNGGDDDEDDSPSPQFPKRNREQLSIVSEKQTSQPAKNGDHIIIEPREEQIKSNNEKNQAQYDDSLRPTNKKSTAQFGGETYGTPPIKEPKTLEKMPFGSGSTVPSTKRKMAPNNFIVEEEEPNHTDQDHNNESQENGKRELRSPLKKVSEDNLIIPSDNFRQNKPQND